MADMSHSVDRVGWPFWRIALWGAIAILLLLPAVAMLFTREVNWGAEDFAAALVLLVGGGGAFELAARRAEGSRKRWAIGIAILAVVALVWAEMAVGIF